MCWHGLRESNPQSRFWRPPLYHLTKPARCWQEKKRNFSPHVLYYNQVSSICQFYQLHFPTLTTIDRSAYRCSMSDPMNWFNLYRTNEPPTLKYNRLLRQKTNISPPLIKNQIARNILFLLALGAGGALVTTSPAGGLALIMHGALSILMKKRDYQREIKRLEKRGYVALTKTPDGTAVKLLKRARRRLQMIVFEDLQLPKAERWDRKWRFYIFDIPEQERMIRKLLSRKLKTLGMANIQRSVFAYPYDCRKELDFLSEYYKVGHYTIYAEVNYSDIDQELRNFFRL